MGVYLAEYVWLDGYKPLPRFRSKTRVVNNGDEPPVWGFDGSSTEQAPGEHSDCVLQPVYWCTDPFRGDPHKLVMCEVMHPDGSAHPSNTRAKCREVYERFKHHEPWFGMEQEYTYFNGFLPLGWPVNGFPAPQGMYYCGVGADIAFGREYAERHLELCVNAGIGITGTNAAVMPGQWEFQIFAKDPLTVGDQMWLARWILERLVEPDGIHISYHPKPMKGDWNGAGCHTNFSTKEMRENYNAILTACEALSKKHDTHIANYGADIEQRLTGKHETCSYKEYKYGVSDRGASVRIPWQVKRDGRGYIEDRRPNANIDPYVVSCLMVETICTALEEA